MSVITQVPIAVSRYAPADSKLVTLYNFNGAENMTLGQMLMAVCINRAAAIEHSSTLKINDLASTSGLLNALALATEKITEQKDAASAQGGSVKLSSLSLDLTDTGYTPSKVSMQTTVYSFMVTELGLTVDDTMDSYDDVLDAFYVLKPVIDEKVNLAEEQAIDLESLVNRRDVAYNTSTTTVASMMKDAGTVAGNF